MSKSDRDADTVVTRVPPSGNSPPSSRRAAIPTQLGRYTIRRMLGKGGVGAVYEADDPELGRKVAIKVLREDREGDKEDIRREAQALAKLVHPNVVTVHDVGVAGDDVYLVMQLVSAQTIDGYLRARHPSKDRIVELFRQAGEGLAAAHAAGVVHCDFKPGNVLVDEHGHVRVSDFGLAKVRTDANAASSMLQIAGTPAYMAPEQFAGHATPASDQFAFCVALWEALAGERPFPDTGLEYVERKPPPKHPKIPARFARVLERGMATEEADRYPSMTALLAELRPRHVGRYIAIGALGAAAIGVAAFVMLRRDPIANVRAEADVEKPLALTKFGSAACAYAPAIEPGGRDVVFDRTEGEVVDLYAVPLAGGAPRQLTTSPLWEWRAQPGRRAGEVVHLIHHPKDADNEPRVAYLDLATGKSEIAMQRLVWDAVVVGDTLYYAPDLPHGVWRLSPAGETDLAKPPEGLRFIMLAGSRRAIAAIGSNTDDGPVRPCVIDIETRAVRCSPTEATPARPAFGADGTTLYFAVDAEIRAWDLASNAETVIFKGDYPEGGLAIARDGSALVYSNCFARSQIVDAVTNTALVDDQNATQPTFAANGALAWISFAFRSRVLVVALPDGTRKQLTNIARQSIHTPSFKHDGTAIVFKSAAPNAGLFVVNVTSAGETAQLTNNEGDENPLFTADDHIVFTRTDGTGNARPFIMNRDGAEQRPLGTGASRTVYGTRGTDLLVFAKVSESLYWMDIATGTERPGPPKPPGQFQYASLSPDGNWLVYQLGANGQSLWRLHLAAPDAKPEPVRDYAAGQTVGLPAIDDTGRVLATPATWSGDVFVLRPKPGHRF